MATLARKNRIHACGKFDTDGTILVAGTGNWSVVHNGNGDYTVTLSANALIDPAERVIHVQSHVTSTMAGTIPASDTDSVFQVNVENDASAATDAAVAFVVLRAA